VVGGAPRTAVNRPSRRPEGELRHAEATLRSADVIESRQVVKEGHSCKEVTLVTRSELLGLDRRTGKYVKVQLYDFHH
jgi:hypothetical protein